CTDSCAASAATLAAFQRLMVSPKSYTSWLAFSPKRQSGWVSQEVVPCAAIGTVPPGCGTKFEVARVYEAVPLSCGSNDARAPAAAPSTLAALPRASSSEG